MRTRDFVIALLLGGVVTGVGVAAPPPRKEPPKVRVNGYAFDPLAGEPALDARLRAKGVPAGERGYFLVQLENVPTAQMQRALIQAGGTPLHFLPDDTYVVRAQGAARELLAHVPGVRWVGPFHPAYKLSHDLAVNVDAVLNNERARRLAEAGEPDLQPKVDTRQSVPVRIVTMDVEAVDAVAAAVEDLGGTGVTTSSWRPGLVAATVPRRNLEAIASEPGVLWIERVKPAYVVNDTVVWTIQSDVQQSTPVHKRHLEGQGQTITIADTGLQYSHPAFADPAQPTAGASHRKVTAYYVPGVGDDVAEGDGVDGGGFHGTHVAGIVAGDAGLWHAYNGVPVGGSDTVGPHDGQAHDAKIQLQDLSIDQLGSGISPPSDAHNLFSQAYSNGTFIHTNSWGSFSGGAYTSWGSQIDDFVYTHPNFLVLWAAGNGSPFPGSVFEDGSAKNLITVGNVYKGAGADDLNVSSCRGPALDGRIKPELLAPGSDVWSANGCPGGCSDYVTKSGTSMATPAVAASAALIRQYFTEGWYPTGTKGTGTFVTPSAALLKAMLINSAREIDGAEAYANGENFYPNNQQGWGRIVTDDALFFKGDARKLFMAQGSTGGTGTSVSYSLKVTNSSQPLNVTLVWTDYPSIPNTGTSPTLVNDLDLVVRAPDGTTVYKGNQFNTQHPGESLPNAIGADARNPVETVLVRTGVLGCFSGYASGYTIEVHARRVGAPQCSPPGCSDPPDAQPFALVVTGGLEPDLDADGTKDCTDTDADGDGELNGTDCLPFDARAKHGLIEGPVTVGGTATACQDGLDNDCDGVVDYDCAINIDAANGQWIGPGTVQSGTVADLAAASADDTYEVLRETAVNKSLVSVWTFTVPNNAATYDAVVESFRSGIDYHTYHYLKKTSTTQCNNNLSGWLPLFNVTATADSDQPLRASIGSLTAGTVCIRSSDVGPQNDQTADTQTLDRVFLFPRPACTDADGDGYTSSCTGCVLATCPLLDCDDSDGGLNPGVSTNPFNSERLATCADGDDNDCDGAIDGADAGCQAPPPDVLTSSEAGTPAIDETSALQTYVADNVREVIQEVADSLNHTWTFANVPVGFSHTLKVKAKRRNGGGTENFTVHFSKDGVNFGSSLATITQLEANSALPLPEPVSGTVYVQIRDVGSGSTADQFLEVDFLAIGTTP